MTTGSVTANRVPVVAIVGRPNVGKSTLFNRIIGERIAVTEDIPGTTRDRLYSDCVWQDSQFLLVDTAGVSYDSDDELGRSAQLQVELAIDQADVIMFVIDATAPLTPVDLDVAQRLRTSSKPVMLVVNKVDNDKRALDVPQAYELGLDDPIAISAYHSLGIGELLDQVVSRLPFCPPREIDDELVNVAIVGRPNVGKSQLLNRLVGEQRVLVSDRPGTTRDAVDTLLEIDGRRYRLIDTAGIRRRGAVGAGAEQYSVLRALQAINRADVVLVLLDAREQATAQDLHVAGYVKETHKGMVVLVNKWDLVERDEATAHRARRFIRSRFRFMPYAPILFVSALTGFHVNRILTQVDAIAEARAVEHSTPEVNRTLAQATRKSVLPRDKGKQLNVLYGTQIGTNPPTFLIFVNEPALVHFSYRRYLENSLRDALDFGPTPLKLIFRRRDSKKRAHG